MTKDPKQIDMIDSSGCNKIELESGGYLILAIQVKHKSHSQVSWSPLQKD